MKIIRSAPRQPDPLSARQAAVRDPFLYRRNPVRSRFKHHNRKECAKFTSSERGWRDARRPGGSRARGGRAVLYEMRPQRQTAAHKTGAFAELVCSNSLKSGAGK